MHYKTMIFDIDGTLTDSASAILYALRQAVLKITGKDYDEKELLFALGVPSHLAMKKLTGDRWREAMEVGQNYYQEGLKNIHLFNGIENTIKELYKKGTQLGIVTSKSRAEFQRSFLIIPFIHTFPTSSARMICLTTNQIRNLYWHAPNSLKRIFHSFST